jgi:SPP1 family predicted phage head-tail adaptor
MDDVALVVVNQARDQDGLLGDVRDARGIHRRADGRAEQGGGVADPVRPPVGELLRIGPLRNRITIEEKTVTRDAYGGEVVVWAKFAEVWASVQSITGREFFGSQQVNATVTTKFGIRWLEGVTTAMRISYDGELYNIVAILDSDRRADLMLLTEEVART